jgi:hypothetical protein
MSKRERDLEDENEALRDRLEAIQDLLTDPDDEEDSDSEDE